MIITIEGLRGEGKTTRLKEEFSRFMSSRPEAKVLVIGHSRRYFDFHSFHGKNVDTSAAGGIPQHYGKQYEAIFIDDADFVDEQEYAGLLGYIISVDGLLVTSWTLHKP